MTGRAARTPRISEELTPRQRAVLRLIAEGRTNFEIAQELGITLEGAKYHVREILARLEVGSREEAAAWWRGEQRPAARLRRGIAVTFTGTAFRIAAATAGAAAVGAAIFVGYSLLNNGDGIPPSAPVATATSTSTLPAPTATPTPRYGIDTSQPGWDQAYLDAYRAKPLAVVELSGMRIGPDGTAPSDCPSRDLLHAVDPSEAAGTAFAIEPQYLPPGVVLSPDPSRTLIGATVACEGRIVLNDARGSLPSAPDLIERLAAGESWFDIPHGGYLEVSKMHVPEGAQPVFGTSIPAEHWEARTIAGLPAAVGRPVLDAGLGTGEAYVWNPAEQVVTQVRSYNLSTDELMRIAEGLQ